MANLKFVELCLICVIFDNNFKRFIHMALFSGHVATCIHIMRRHLSVRIYYKLLDMEK